MATIIDIINDLGGGLCYDEANKLINEVTAAVLDTGKTGKVTISIEVKRNGENRVALTPDVKAKIPQHSMGQSIFYADDKSGDLSRQDPRQKNLPLRDVSKTNDEVRELS